MDDDYCLLLSYASLHGVTQLETLEEEIPQTTNTAHRWIMDMLPKGKNLKPLVSEFQDGFPSRMFSRLV
jgi:hypothetical protein